MTDRPGNFAVCVVTWRSRDLLRSCLSAVLAEPQVAEIAVVDNASGDGTVEMVRQEFPTAIVIANRANRGFAAGCNQAINATDSEFALLLNPDTEVQPGALAAMERAFREDERVGAVAAQLVLPDGTVQRSCRSFPDPGALFWEALGMGRLFPKSHVIGRYRMRYWDHNSRAEVEQPMYSALALRRTTLAQVGLFDEAFPLYFNDVDLSYRMKQAGWRTLFQPEARVIHHFGRSSTWQVRPSAILQSHRGLIRFYRKHYAGRIPRLPYLAVVVGSWMTMWPRAGLSSLLRRGSRSR